jgi:diacylglycerol kinase family enzyme
MAGPTVFVDAERPLPIEADGEMVGLTPATFSVLPGILPLVA